MKSLLLLIKIAFADFIAHAAKDIMLFVNVQTNKGYPKKRIASVMLES